jgi:hypothetical protein
MEFVVEIHEMGRDAWTKEQLEMIRAQASVYERMFAGAPAHLKLPRIPGLYV